MVSGLAFCLLIIDCGKRQDLTLSACDDSPLRLESLMPENGVLLSDGIQNDFIEFNSGCTVEVGISDRVGRLII